MYAEHFGFSKLPFSVTPDPQVFFNNSLYREAFAKLRYGVLEKKGFVVITGDVGTGKTLLVRKLLHSLGPTVHPIFISKSQVSFVELLRLILEDLNLACGNNDEPTMIERLKQGLIERLRQGHIVALLIDEAQDLCDEAFDGLRLLSNLKIDTEKLLQIVLMGRPELEIKLDHPKLRQLKQRITIQCRLAPLKSQEVGAYIEFRLNTAGFRSQSPFDRDSIKAIAYYSKGIPRLLNVICDKALVAAFAASETKVSAQMVEKVALGLQLGPPPPIQARHLVSHKMPDNPVGPRTREDRLPEFENVLVGAEKRRRAELQRKHGLTGFGVAVFLGAVFLGGIAVSYTAQTETSLSALATNWGDFSRDRLAGLPARLGAFVRSNGKNPEQLTPTTEMSKKDFSAARSAEARGMNAAKRIEPLDVAEKPPPAGEHLDELSQDNQISLPETGQSGETQIAKDIRPLPESHAISDGSKVLGPEAHQPASLEPEAASSEGLNEGQTSSLGNFEVVGRSFVRDRPVSDAAIVTTLQPGSRVQVESKSGKYLRVSSLKNPEVRGYVHEQDAFFRRIK